jgi:hypothetical protein
MKENKGWIFDKSKKEGYEIDLDDKEVYDDLSKNLKRK